MRATAAGRPRQENDGAGKDAHRQKAESMAYQKKEISRSALPKGAGAWQGRAGRRAQGARSRARRCENEAALLAALRRASQGLPYVASHRRLQSISGLPETAARRALRGLLDAGLVRAECEGRANGPRTYTVVAAEGAGP